MSATTPPPPWLASGRIPSLDGLRAISVVLVLFAHAHQTHGFPQIPFVAAVGRRGAIGVEVFFVISGFLITLLMLRERSRTGQLAIGPFYRRRALRILPAYVCLLAVVAILQGLGLAALRAGDWIAAATYTVNFLRHPAWEIGHAWSLSIEEHFYLMWPIVLALVPRLGPPVALGCMISCFAARWVVMLVTPTETPMAELWTFTRLDSIATGCLLAFLASDGRWRSRLDRLCSSPLLRLAWVLALIGSLTLSAYSAKFAVGIAYTFNSICIALLIWAATTRAPSPVGRLLNHPVVAAIGIGSYSIYLWQQVFLNPHAGGWFRTYPQNILLALVVAAASYFFVERPFIVAKTRLDQTGASPEIMPESRITVPEHRGIDPDRTVESSPRGDIEWRT